MKKILKYASLFIITITLLFSFNFEVKAACEGETDETCRVGERGEIKAGGNGWYFRPTLSQNTSTTRTPTGPRKYKNSVYYYYTDAGANAYFNGNGYFLFHAYNESKSAMFCLDAQYEGQNPIYAERFLLNSNSSLRIKAYDYALMYILTNGGQASGIMRNVSDISDYWARLTALRAITYIFGYNNGFSKSQDSAIKYESAYYANLTATHNWINSDSSAFNNLNNALKAKGSGGVTNVPSYSKYYYSGNSLSKAQAYFNGALNAAAEFVSKSSGGANVKKGTITPDPEVKETDKRQGLFVEKNVVHTITVSGIPKKEGYKFVINGIKFPDGVQYDGLTSYISQVKVGDTVIFTGSSQEEFDSTLKGKNLIELGYDFTNETNIEITVHFEGFKNKSQGSNITTLKCGQSPIKYSIDGEYTSNEFGEYGKFVATIWYSGKSNMQRYVGVEELKGDPTTSTWTSDYQTYLIDACACEDLEEACKEEASETGNFNGDACQELKDSNCGECSWLEVVCEVDPSSPECDEDKKAEVCDATCESYYETFECCDEQGELIVSVNDDKEVNIKGIKSDSDIKVCFVKKLDDQAKQQGSGKYGNNTNIPGITDQNKNTFTLTAMKENSYCSVSCKEDYLSTMPNAKLVNAGRYFTFKARIDGTKTCFSDTIDRDKYHNDIIEAQKALILQYNNFRKYYELYNNGKIEPVPGTYPSSCTCDSHGCGPSCTYSDYFPQWLATATVPNWQTFISADYSSGMITKTENAQGVSENYEYERTIGATSYSCPGGSWTTTDSEGNTTSHSCSGGSTTYYTGTQVIHTEQQFRDYLRSRMMEELAVLQGLQQEYRDIIKEYNACTGNWTGSEIKYEANVTYDYEEQYLDKFSLIGKMDEDLSGISNSEWYCNLKVSSSGYVAPGTDVNANYESCISGNSSAKHLTTLYYDFCDASAGDPGGCGKTRSESRQDISDAKYKKTISKISANYKPATLFYNVYPSGEIEINQTDKNVALENKLPVALGTARGIYKYTVNVENLGEFYDTGKLGRYVGSNTAIIDPQKLVYNCSYLVNMAITDEDTLICDFDETCTDDCISECRGPNCDANCDGIDCVANCVGLGCIYDKDAGSSLLERTVSLNNLFPNGTDSYNWTNYKGEVTRDEIQNEDRDNGEAIFDTDPVLSVTITPSVARQIRSYNQSVEDQGGYSNSTLDCRALGGYSEIACYSTFISDLLNGKYGSDTVNKVSMIADSSYRTVSDNNDEYFKLWTSGVSEDQMIGPSWK